VQQLAVDETINLYKLKLWNEVHQSKGSLRAVSEDAYLVMGILSTLPQACRSAQLAAAIMSMSPLPHSALHPAPRLAADTPMYDLLKLFRVGRSHMALLTQPHPDNDDASTVTVSVVGSMTNQGLRAQHLKTDGHARYATHANLKK
jgi:hypothetical protein